MAKIITDYLRFMESAAKGDRVWGNEIRLYDSTGIVPFPLSDFPTDFPGASWRAAKTITVYTGSPNIITRFDPGGSTQNIWVCKDKLLPMQYCFPGGGRGGGAKFNYDTHQPGYLYELVIEDPIYLDRPGLGWNDISSNYPSHLKWYNVAPAQKNIAEHRRQVGVAVICGGKVIRMGVTKYVPYTVDYTERLGIPALFLKKPHKFNIDGYDMYPDWSPSVAKATVWFDTAVKLGILTEGDRAKIESDKSMSEVTWSFLQDVIKRRDPFGTGDIRTFRAEGREQQPLITAKDVEDHLKLVEEANSDMAQFVTNKAASNNAFVERIERFLKEVNGG
jgi:hypothetical protein